MEEIVEYHHSPLIRALQILQERLDQYGCLKGLGKSVAQALIFPGSRSIGSDEMVRGTEVANGILAELIWKVGGRESVMQWVMGWADDDDKGENVRLQMAVNDKGTWLPKEFFSIARGQDSGYPTCQPMVTVKMAGARPVLTLRAIRDLTLDCGYSSKEADRRASQKNTQHEKEKEREKYEVECAQKIVRIWSEVLISQV